MSTKPPARDNLTIWRAVALFCALVALFWWWQAVTVGRGGVQHDTGLRPGIAPCPNQGEAYVATQALTFGNRPPLWFRELADACKVKAVVVPSTTRPAWWGLDPTSTSPRPSPPR